MDKNNCKILVVGLGNPGLKYALTRHNVGFMVVDSLGELPNNIKVLKPDTFMNLSGQSVAKTSQYYQIPVENIWVVHDDMDIDFGDLRVRQGGSSGGHNGIKSIVAELKSDNFWRLRFGIGRPSMNIPSEDYVLSKFIDEEVNKIPRLIDQTKQIVLSSLSKEKLIESTYNLK